MVKFKSLLFATTVVVVVGWLGPVGARSERRYGDDPFNDDFLAEVKRHAKTWTPDNSFRNGIEFENFRAMKGIYESKIGFHVPTKIHHAANDVDIPEHFDAREEWPFCKSITTIKNQGLCGACWAVAAVSVMSDRMCIHSGGKFDLELAAEDLMACCKDCGNGCNGGALDGTAFQYWVDVGLVSGAAYNSTDGCKPYPFKPCLYPFEGCHPEKSPTCTHHCAAGYDGSYRNDKYYGTAAYKIPNDERMIQLEIMTNGPVESGFSVFQDLYLYRSGVYRHVVGREVGKHAVRLIGWGKERGVPYWLIANSYGTDWGEHGYFKMLRGSNHLGIESVVIAGLPKV